MTQLNRTLGLSQVIFFGTGSILGAGIYALIGKVAGFSGNMIWLSFAIASLAAFCTALSYAELSGLFPKTGAEYEYVSNAMSPGLGLFIAVIIATNGIVSGATVSLGFAGYFSQLLDFGLFKAAALIIVIIWLINLLGIRESSTVNIIFTIIEVAGLLLIVYCAWPHMGSVNFLEFPDGGMNHILLGAALSYFAYIGFEEIVKLSEEMKQPEKNLPRALFICSIIVFVIYILVALCAVSAIPWQELGKSDHPLADIAEGRLGQAGVTTIAIIALFSTSNTILANMTGSSRILLGISKDRPSLKWLGYILPKRKTPAVALILVSLVMIAFAAIGKLEKVALIANFFIFITFLFVNASALILRKKSPSAKRSFRIPVNIGKYPISPFMGILLTLMLLGYTIYGLFVSAL